MIAITKHSWPVLALLAVAFSPAVNLQQCRAQAASKQIAPAHGHGQTVALHVDNEVRPVLIPNAVQCDVTSSHGVRYRLFIDAPLAEAPADGWPVVYCTDGNENFGVVAQVVRRMSRSQSNAIVVGIGYVGESRQEYLKRRSYDLTFPASDEWVRDKLTILKDHDFGGADQFLDFLTLELRPWLASQYKINPNKQTLVGHSFGGLFVIYTAMVRPAAFSGYLAISPSLWWADGAMQHLESAGLARISRLGVKPRLFVAVGEHEQGASKHVVAERPNLLNESPMLDQSAAFVQRLVAENSGIDALFIVVPDAHHGSVFVPAVAQGLANLLDQDPSGGENGK